jgi:hypothetical protein
MSGRAMVLRTISAAMLAACVVAPAFAVDGKASIDLEENSIGVPPLEDFDFVITGGGQPGQWTMVRDVTAIGGVAIEQSSKDLTENRLPLAIYRPLALKNLAASIRLKLINGTMQSAGIAFRFVDADNYYVVSASALEGRIDLFRILGGKMERIGGGEADVALNHWHQLSLVAEGDRITVSFDNAWLFTVWDRAFLTDGRIGLWTEEDNVTRFDQFEIKALPWSEDR